MTLETVCDKKGICKSYPYKCNTCKNNNAKRKDYYEPDDDYYSIIYPIIWGW